MTRTARQVRLLAETLDSQGKADAPIAVIGTRSNLLREFKPAERGGALRCGSHELQLIKRAPKAAPLDNLDWVGP